MTRRDVLDSQHEPFGDAFYFGPEFLSDRFRDDEAARKASAECDETYKSILDRFAEVEKQVRLLLCDRCCCPLLARAPSGEAH